MVTSMADQIQDIIERLERIEQQYGLHLGPQSGATSLNLPHTGLPYLNSDHKIKIDDLPTGTGADEVALGNHAHSASVWGYYL